MAKRTKRKINKYKLSVGILVLLIITLIPIYFLTKDNNNLKDNTVNNPSTNPPENK